MIGIFKVTCAALACLLSACTHSLAGNGTQPDPVVLSPARPAMQAERPEGQFERLRVRVTEVRNPNARALAIRVTAIDPASGRRQEIGRFAIFPAEQTGDYMLPISAAVTAALTDDEAMTEFALISDVAVDAKVSVTLIPIWE